jgi:DNA-binding PadR family transcriptional regulator
MSIRSMWRTSNIKDVIIELLRRKKTIKDSELLKAIRMMYKDVSSREINKALMYLELNGLIKVSRMKKTTRNIEFISY